MVGSAISQGYSAEFPYRIPSDSPVMHVHIIGKLLCRILVNSQVPARIHHIPLTAI